MSDRNVEMVRGSFDLWNRGDFETLAAAHTVDAEWDLSGFTGWPDQPAYRGAEGLRTYWDALFESWGEFYVEPLRLVDVGDRVFAHGRFTGSGKRSGVPISFEYGQITTFGDDGRVVRNEIFMDVSEALEAAGMSK